jgi:flap endonuclease-1
MGIKNLLKFLLQKSYGIKSILITDYSNKKIAIDTSIILYQSVITIRNSGNDLINKKGELSSHILGLFNKTIELLENKISPLYVFDGKPPDIKKDMLNARKQVRQKALEKLSMATDEKTKIKYLKKAVNITKNHNEQCREMLNYMGIPYINADEEADKTLSYLCKNKIVDGVLSEDMDILTFGSTRIVKNLISLKKNPIEINLCDILNKLDLSHDQFIEFCILLGSDYLNGISEINSKIIFDFYNKHKNINNVLLDLKKNKFKVPDKIDYSDVKDYFQNSPHVKVSPDDLNLNIINYSELLKLLVGKYGLIKYKIKNKLNKLINNEFYNNYVNKKNNNDLNIAIL